MLGEERRKVPGPFFGCTNSNMMQRKDSFSLRVQSTAMNIAQLLQRKPIEKIDSKLSFELNYYKKGVSSQVCRMFIEPPQWRLLWRVIAIRNRSN